MNEKQSSEELIKETILQLTPIEVWNKAISFAIESVREVLREESSELTYSVASDLQVRLRQLML